MDKVRVGFIGAGGLANHVHYPSVAEDSRAELAAICDLDAARARELAVAYAVPRIATELAALCRMEDLDVIDICTPPSLHAELALESVKHNCHVLCEKPLTLNPSDYEALSDQQLSVQASADDVTPSVGRYLRRSGAITEAELKAAQAKVEAERITLAAALTGSGKLSEEDWITGALEKAIDEVAEVVLWRETDLKVRNRARAFSGKFLGAGPANA